MQLSHFISRAALAGLTILGLSTAAGSASAATTVTVAAPNGNSPYIINTDHGAGGYYGALIKKIDRDLPQYKFKTTFTSQNAVFAGLQSGKYDVAMSNFWYNKQRFNNYYHTRANGLDDLRLVERKNGKHANSLAEVAKKKLTVVPVSTSDARYSLLENYKQQHPNNKLNLKGIGNQTTGDALKQVASGKYDVAVYPYAAYKSVQTTAAGKNLTASKSIGLESSYFLLHKSPANKKLTAAMNKELKKLHDDGYLKKLTKKYLYENTFKLPGAQKEFNAHN